MSERSKDELIEVQKEVIGILFEIIKRLQANNGLDEEFIKVIFKKILECGENYNVEEIESWFKNEGTWQNTNSVIRITNMAHYMIEKYEQSNKFRILSDENSCKCD